VTPAHLAPHEASTASVPESQDAPRDGDHLPPEYDVGSQPLMTEMSDAIWFRKQEIVALLRRVGLQEVADEANRSLPEQVDFERAAKFVEPYGITKDDLISRMGGSP
jgi:hypothetical protein